MSRCPSEDSPVRAAASVIDTPKTRERMPDKIDEFFVEAADIALAVLNLVAQPRSARSFEADLRPFGEDG